MNECERARKHIREGQIDQARDHLQRCASCTAFAEAHEMMRNFESQETLSDQSLPLDQLFEDINAQLSSQTSVRRRLSALSSSRRIALMIIISAFVLGAVFVLVRRLDWFLYPAPRLMFELGFLIVLFVVYLWTVIRPLHLSPLRRGARVLPLIAVLVVILAPLALPLAHQALPESLRGVGEDLAARALACFFWGIGVSGIIGIASYLFMRGARGISSMRIGYWLLAGLFAELALHIHCPLVHPLHIALGHLTIIPAFLVVWLILRFSSTRLKKRLLAGQRSDR